MEAEVRVANCQVIVGIDVQWRDLDVLAHVNNAEYIKWFETARIEALARIELLTEEGRLPTRVSLGPILGSVSCRYIKPVGFPARVRVGTYLSRMGSSSFDLSYVVELLGTDEIVATGDSVLVHYNYHEQCSAPLSDALKSSIVERLSLSVADE